MLVWPPAAVAADDAAVVVAESTEDAGETPSRADTAPEHPVWSESDDRDVAATAPGGLAPGQRVPLAQLVAALKERSESTTPYDRKDFDGWIDADGNGCDTRQEVLIAESLVPVTKASGGCRVVSGKWFSYLDQTESTDPSKVSVIRLVAPKEAWESGAHAWSTDQRKRFANDLGWPASLLAVSSSVNGSRSDRDPAQWIPSSAGAQCRYLAEWVTVKYRWGLSADSAELQLLRRYSGDGGACRTSMVEVPSRTDTVPDDPGPGPGPDDLGKEYRAYVTQVYRDLFNRTPDSAGLTTWTTALANGRHRGDVARSITASREYRSRLIVASYQKFLGRGPDAGGLETWLGVLNRGGTIQEMEAGFLASQEYYNKAGGTDAKWVQQLYRHVLDRGAGPSEVDHWVGYLSRGMTRRGVSMGFLLSTEYLSTVVDGYYQQLLRRGLDASGKQTWVTSIQRGVRTEEIIASIVSSQEYWNKVTPLD